MSLNKHSYALGAHKYKIQDSAYNYGFNFADSASEFLSRNPKPLKDSIELFIRIPCSIGCPRKNKGAENK